ncbi:MAG TPA: cytochrome c [Terriglobia bacterium]|nr:cytochrome c [Terriglobia bacterium]
MREIKARLVVAIVIGAFCGVTRVALRAQGTASVWDGVYTGKQAERGSVLYGQRCASCHGDHLQGKRPQTPALTGSGFKGNWNGETVDDLFEKIQTAMPADKPGTLSRPQNADALAFILKANEFPAGQAELPTDAEKLKQIRFEAERPAK